MNRCGECGGTNLNKQNIKGTRHPWKDYLNVELLNDQEVFVCANCGNHIMSSQDVIDLDQNIVRSIQRTVAKAIDYLTKEMGLTQLTLAEIIGVTPEYLSMVKSGNKRLKFTAYSLLTCYWKNPELIEQQTGISVPNLSRHFEKWAIFIGEKIEAPNLTALELEGSIAKNVVICAQGVVTSSLPKGEVMHYQGSYRSSTMVRQKRFPTPEYNVGVMEFSRRRGLRHG